VYAFQVHLFCYHPTPTEAILQCSSARYSFCPLLHVRLQETGLTNFTLPHRHRWRTTCKLQKQTNLWKFNVFQHEHKYRMPVYVIEVCDFDIWNHVNGTIGGQQNIAAFKFCITCRENNVATLDNVSYQQLTTCNLQCASALVISKPPTFEYTVRSLKDLLYDIICTHISYFMFMQI
jgi:hypothetical protein